MGLRRFGPGKCLTFQTEDVLDRLERGSPLERFVEGAHEMIVRFRGLIACKVPGRI